MIPETDQAYLSNRERANMAKESVETLSKPIMDYPIPIDKKTIIFPKTKKRYEMLSRTYPDGTCKIGKQ